MQTLPLSPLLVLESFGQVLPQGVQTPVLQASDDYAATDEDHSVTIDVLANDSTLGPGQVTVASVTLPSHGTTIINPDNTITYIPNQDFFGEDSFEYTATYSINGMVLDSETATVFVTINPVNDAPVAIDDSAVTDEDTVVMIDVVANDFDVDGDPLRVVGALQPTNGIARPFSASTIGYSPDNEFFGTESFAYTISDGNGGTDTATVTITVNPVNDAPVAADDSAQTSINQPVTIEVLANDSDPDGDSLSVTSTSTPSNGTAAINANNTITYSPDSNFAGNDSFTYSVSDGNGGTDTATVTVTVSRTIATIPVDFKPRGLDVNPNTNTIYVAHTPGTISVIDGSSNQVIKTFDDVGFQPKDVAVNTETNMVYVLEDIGIQVINGTTNTIVDIIPLGGNLLAVDVNPNTNMIYVADARGHNTVIDGNTNEVIATIEDVPMRDVAVNHNTNKIYFAMRNGTVAVVDGTTNTITDTIPSLGESAVGVNTITNTIYAADLGDFSGPTEVTVFDGSNNSIIDKVLVGNAPRGIAVNEKTNIIYVTNSGDDTVSVIDGQTNQVIETIPIGDGPGGDFDNPSGIAVNQETNRVYVAHSTLFTVEGQRVTVLQGIE